MFGHVVQSGNALFNTESLAESGYEKYITEIMGYVVDS